MMKVLIECLTKQEDFSLFVPINDSQNVQSLLFSGTHWSLLVIERKGVGTYSYYIDSLVSTPSLPVAEQVVRYVNIGSVTTLNSVKQPDSYNCGVYVCWFMDIIIKHYQAVGIIDIVQRRDLLPKDISNVETFRIFLEENDIDKLQGEPEQNERIQLLQAYKQRNEQERRTRTRAVTPSKQRIAPTKRARKSEPLIEVVTSLSSHSRKKPNVITLTSSIHRFFPTLNVKWLRSHLKTSAKIMRYATLLARRFVVEYPHLAFALTHQHFWLACTDVFTT
ncbi:hypothetical protein RCL1_008153 [Eukaryota sp. TZLM3-RCL]